MDECVRLSEEVMRLESEGKEAKRDVSEAREAVKAAKKEAETAAAKELAARHDAEQVWGWCGVGVGLVWWLGR